MTIKLLIILSFIFSCNSILLSQEEEFVLSSEQKAFIYHVIWKNKRLDQHLGKYFEYIGEPYLKNSGKPKRDSVEWSIEQNGQNLLIRTNELSKVSKGMLMELCNKLALHDINLIIKHRSSEEEVHQKYIDQYETIIDLLTKKLPPSATREKDGKKRPLIKFEKVLAPSYSTKSKMNVVSSGGAYDANETKVIVKAINETIKLWVQNRARKYFETFGGRSIVLDNELMSAGDGSGFPGASKERKQDRWFRGLTHPIGFFYYHTEPKKDKKSGNLVLKAKHVPIITYNTYGYDTLTNIHFDVWGKSQERQPTVVIQKGMYSYILYGKDETDLLSPDSAYGKEGVTTYQMLIDELEDVHINHYEELIYGKRGYDYQIEYHSGQIDVCLEKIKVTEFKLNQIRYKNGSGNVVNYKPKANKNSQPSSNESVTKKKKTTQDVLMYWYQQLEYHKEMVRKLKEEKAIALELLATLKDKLSEMNQNLGYKILTWEEKDGLYLFEDSSTFNYETQDFKFAKHQYPEEFNIRILAFDEKVLSSQADEVQIHWSINEEDEDEQLKLNRNFIDEFKLNETMNNAKVLTEKDSVVIKELIQFIVDNPKKISMDLHGNGKGIIKSNGKFSQDKQPEYFKEYPNDHNFKVIDATTLKVSLNQALHIEVQSYTDGKIVDYKPVTKEGIKLADPDSGIHINELVSGIRTQNYLINFIYNLRFYGSKYFKDGEAEKAFDILQKIAKKTKTDMGGKNIKMFNSITVKATQ